MIGRKRAQEGKIKYKCQDVLVSFFIIVTEGPGKNNIKEGKFIWGSRFQKS